MTNSYFNYLKILDKLILLILITLPIQLMCGSGIFNTGIILIDIFFLIILFNQKTKIIDKKILYLFLFFFTSLIINSFFSTRFDLSIDRALGFLRFPIFVFAIIYILKEKTARKKIFFYWSIFFAIVTFDLIFEFLTGNNILGFKSYMPGRLAGFLNKELKIGNFYYGFCLIAVSYVNENLKKNNELICTILIILIVITSFLIGERSNFIKLLLICTFYYLIVFNNKIWLKMLLILLGILTSIILLLNIENEYRYRYSYVINSFENYNFLENINKSQYGQHYKTAIKIFSKYKIFGSGLRTFRVESFKEEYADKNDLMTNWRGNIHPHQLHFEILSETGIFGYIVFIIFFSYFLIQAYKKLYFTKNPYQLSAFLFVIASFLPLLPSGSFFNSYGASIFWINFAIMTTYNKKYF